MGVLTGRFSEDEEGEVNQSLEEQNKVNNSVVEYLVEDPEDDSFVNSLLDHDFLVDWATVGGECENPDLSSSFEKVELNAMEGVNTKCDASAEERVDGELLKLDVVGDVGPENSEKKMGGDVSCEKVMFEEGATGDGCFELVNLRCSIEEEMVKVNLDGVSNASCLSATENADLEVAKEIAVKESGVDSVVPSVGVVNAGENGNEIVVAGLGGGCQPVSVDGYAGKNHGYDVDESDSDSDSDSESESESDDDDEEEEEEVMSKKEGHDAMLRGKSKDLNGEEVREMEDGEIVISDNEDGSDGCDTGAGPIRSKNEITDLPPVPRVNVTLQPQHETLPVGAVSSIIDCEVVIQGIEKHNPLNEGSILWITERRSPLGIVEEIFGQVKSPYYRVRYNSRSEMPSGIKPGTLVSYVQEFANHVLNDKSIYQKGYDASGANDEELLGEEEFSDDEKEAEHRKLKMKKRGMKDEKVGNKKIGQKKYKFQLRKLIYDQSAAANPQVPLGQGIDRSSSCQSVAANPQVPLGQGNDRNSSGQGRGVICQHGMVHPFAQIGPNPSFNMPCGGSNVCPFQFPRMQTVHPPTYQMSVPSGLPHQEMSLQSGLPFQQMPMPLQSGLPYEQQIDPPPNLPLNPILPNERSTLSGLPFQQMPLQSGLPYEQQIDPPPNLPLNPILPNERSTFYVIPPEFQPRPTFRNQGMHDVHPPFGMVGTPGQQHTPLPTNLGEQPMPPYLSRRIGYDQTFQPDNPVSFNATMPRPRFNDSRYSSGGRRSHGRRSGGGRFGPGRGRQQGS